MKVLAASAFEAGSHFAHAINTVKMAEGFALAGCDVRLACARPAAGELSASQLARDYGLRAPVRWIQVAPRWLGRPLGPHRGFALRALPLLVRERPDLVYARDYGLPTMTARLGVPTAVETHAAPGVENPAFLRLVRASGRPALRAWVTIADVLRRGYAARGVPEDKILVLPDAVDVELFEPPDLLPPSPYAGERPVVAYAGHLYEYKGIPSLLAAARKLPEVDFHLVGGWPEDVARWRQETVESGAANVRFHGLRPHAEVPPFLWHADVLVLPPSARHQSAAWTSPVKLGEYLASGTPVVATRIPALERWLTEEEVEWAAPDDPDALATSIRRLLDDPIRAKGLVERAARSSARMGYEARASRIVEAMGLAEDPS
jgi:glycosyltransferase involved in cell wall biosynthesis